LTDYNSKSHSGGAHIYIHMPGAIVLITAEIGEEARILEEVCKIEEVERGYLIYGVYDIILEVRARSMEELEQIITGRIRQIDGVRSTLTLIVSKQCK